MYNDLINALVAVVDKYGKDIFSDSQEFIKAFTETAPNLKKERSILKMALDEGLTEYFMYVTESEKEKNIATVREILDGILAESAIDMVVEIFDSIFNHFNELKIDKLVKENQALKAENDNLLQQIDMLKFENDTLKFENDALKCENKDLKCNIDMLECENTELENILEKCEINFHSM